MRIFAARDGEETYNAATSRYSSRQCRWNFNLTKLRYRRHPDTILIYPFTSPSNFATSPDIHHDRPRIQRDLQRHVAETTRLFPRTRRPLRPLPIPRRSLSPHPRRFLPLGVFGDHGDIVLQFKDESAGRGDKALALEGVGHVDGSDCGGDDVELVSFVASYLIF
jgi:hypothetical protein